MGATDIFAASLRKHRSSQRLSLEQDRSFKDENSNAGEASPRLKGREIPSRYRSATVSSNAHHRSPSPSRARARSPSLVSPNRETSPENGAPKRGTAISPGTSAILSSERPRPPSAGAENKSPHSSSPDGATTRDRRRLPARSFDLGLWPSANNSMSSMRFEDADGKSGQNSDAYDQSGALKFSDAAFRSLLRSPSTPAHKEKQGERRMEYMLNPNFRHLDPAADWKLREKTEWSGLVGKGKRPGASPLGKIPGNSAGDGSPEKTAMSLGKHLGEHFENLDSRMVKQVGPRNRKAGMKKGEAFEAEGREEPEKTPVTEAPSTPTTRGRFERRRTSSMHLKGVEEKLTVKPFENLNSKLEAQEQWSQASSDKLDGSSKKTSSLSRVVASLLVPSRYRSGAAKAEKGNAEPMLVRSSSRSTSTSSGLMAGRTNARADRSFHSATETERSTQSFSVLEAGDGMASDTESTSSGGSGARIRLSGSGASWPEVRGGVRRKNGGGTSGKSSPTFRRSSSGAEGRFSAVQEGRFSAVQEAPRSLYPRRGSAALSDAALDLALLQNRCLQWLFINARSAACMQAQAISAQSSLYNVCAKTVKLQKSVSTLKVQVNEAKQHLKVKSMLASMGKLLEEWDSLQSKHSTTLRGVTQALEAAIIKVPLVGGAKVEIKSMKDTLSSATSIMNAMDFIMAKILPKVEVTESLLGELAKTIVLERSFLEELGELMSLASALEIEERSLRAYMLQIEKGNNYIINGNKVVSNSILVH